MQRLIERHICQHLADGRRMLEAVAGARRSDDDVFKLRMRVDQEAEFGVTV